MFLLPEKKEKKNNLGGREMREEWLMSGVINRVGGSRGVYPLTQVYCILACPLQVEFVVLIDGWDERRRKKKNFFPVFSLFLWTMQMNETVKEAAAAALSIVFGIILCSKAKLKGFQSTFAEYALLPSSTNEQNKDARFIFWCAQAILEH